MEKELAKKIIDNCMSLGQELNLLAEFIDQIEDPDKKKVFKRNLGEVMLKIDFDIMMPCVSEFPEFDPDKEESI